MYLRKNAGHMKDLSIQVSQISHNKYKYRLNNTNLVCETCYETCKEAPDNTNKCATQCHHEERSKSR